LAVTAVAFAVIGFIVYVRALRVPKLTVSAPIRAPERKRAELGPGTRVVDVEVRAVVDRAIIIKPEEFNDAEVERVCRAFLAEFGPERGLRRLIVGTSEQVVRLALFKAWPPPPIADPGRTHPSTPGDTLDDFSRAVDEVRRLGLPRGPVARVIAIGPAALFTVRDANGYRERVLTGGSDPTLMNDGSRSYRLLHFVVTVPGPALGRDYYATELFYQANPEVCAASVGRLTHRAKGIVLGGQIAVDVRGDAFFPEVWSYPTILPFQHEASPPQELAYRVGGRLKCGQAGDGEVACAGQNFRP